MHIFKSKTLPHAAHARRRPECRVAPVGHLNIHVAYYAMSTKTKPEWEAANSS